MTDTPTDPPAAPTLRVDAWTRIPQGYAFAIKVLADPDLPYEERITILNFLGDSLDLTARYQQTGGHRFEWEQSADGGSIIEFPFNL